MSTLMYEILITRVFSVTMWYHFAFLAISLALFGLASGAILVYVKPTKFPIEKTNEHLCKSSLLFAVLAITGLFVHIYSPALITNAGSDIIIPVSLLATLPFMAAALTASGTGIALALTRYPSSTSSLYAADLLGAATGCLAVVVTLSHIDAISDVLLVCALASAAAVAFAMSSVGTEKFRAISTVALVAFAVLTGVQANSYVAQSPIITLGWTKGRQEQKNLYQLWNSFSRVRVFGNAEETQSPDPYGLSPRVAANTKVRMLYLDIDGGAGTPILHYAGNPKDVDYLKSEVSNVAHHLRPNCNVLVIGAGGGKDVLSALTMGQKHVTAVEINENVIRSAYEHFADFSGHLKDDPRVTLVNDEARSFVTRSPQKFDVIQISMIDTWAATASGAYSLAENGLYTTDSFKTLLGHLTDKGVLTVSRWYAHTTPSEFYRLTALAAESLKELRIEHPEQHVMAFRIMPKRPDATMIPDGIGTLLVSKSPFTAEDYVKAQELARDNDFEIVFADSARQAPTQDPLLARLARGEEPNVVAKSIPFNLSAPTDDNPFFFQTLSLMRLFEPGVSAPNMNMMNVIGASMLLVASAFTALLTFFSIRLPYAMSADKQAILRQIPMFVYFFAIGAGFMFVEISQIQRLSIFLGHPVYGLSVVLFALLLSTGVGSFLTKFWLRENTIGAIAVLIGVLVLYAGVSPSMLSAMNLASTSMRIATAVTLLFPVGIMLGIGFPIGMSVAQISAQPGTPDLTPWLWGVNGAASVLTSVLAVVVSMFAGISISYDCGILAYVVALAALYKTANVRTAQSQVYSV